MNILVTGGAGFIGINLVNDLLNTTDFSVTVVDRSDLNIERLENSISSGRDRLTVVNTDYDDYDIEDYFDSVIHLAAVPRVGFSIENPSYTTDENISKLVRFLERGKCKFGKFIFASSSSVYGDVQIMTPETHPLKPKSPYALQKKTGEEFMEMFSKLYGLSTVSLRFFTVFGPNQYVDDAYATVIAKWIDHIKKDEPLVLEGDGSQVRDFTYVDNVVRGIKIFINSDIKYCGDRFNLGNSSQTSLNELIDWFETKINFKINKVEPRIGDVFRTHADISKMRNLGYIPIVDVYEGLEKTWKWNMKGNK